MMVVFVVTEGRKHGYVGIFFKLWLIKMKKCEGKSPFMQNESHIPADTEGSLGLFSGTSKSLLNSGLALLSGACHLPGSFWEQEVGGSTEAPRAECWSKWSQGKAQPGPGNSAGAKARAVFTVYLHEACGNWPYHLPFTFGVTQKCRAIVLGLWLLSDHVDSTVEVFPRAFNIHKVDFWDSLASVRDFFFPFCHFSFCNINCSPRSWYSF